MEKKFHNKAEECLDEFQLEQAYQYVKQALDIDSKNINALDVMAAVQMEMGNVDSAKNISFLFSYFF